MSSFPLEEYTATTLKAEVLSYLRYKLQYAIVGAEVWDQDVVGISQSRRMVYVECKRTIDDLRADRAKLIHYAVRLKMGEQLDPLAAKDRDEQWKIQTAISSRYTLPWKFFFAVPEPLKEKAAAVVEERYPYAGLLSVVRVPGSSMCGWRVFREREAKVLNSEKVKTRKAYALVRAVSGSICSAYSALQSWDESYRRLERENASRVEVEGGPVAQMDRAAV